MSALRAALGRVVVFGVLWLILTGATTKAWGLSLLVVGAAVAASLRLAPEVRTPRVVGTLRFIGTFLFQSVRGGVDVALRAFAPRPASDPGFMTFVTRLPAGAPRIFLSGVVGLLPGTVGAGLDENRLRLHVLDRRASVEPAIRLLEYRIAAAIGIELPPLTERVGKG